MAMTKKKIGLIGFGCVGQGLYQLLKEKQFREAEIVAIAVKSKKKKRNAPKELFCYDAMLLVNDQEVDIIVEVIDDPEYAYEIAKRTLRQGKTLISANKKMIATHLIELQVLQVEFGGVLLYEAAVCGAIPVVKKLDELFRYENIRMIRGIFNGTSNYILTKLNRGSSSYQDALSNAQALGFAETDPTNDISGLDALYKTIILARHSFGITLHPDALLRFGIENIQACDLAYARSNSKRIKLVPHLFSVNAKFGAFVLPQMVDISDKLYHVDDEFNALMVESDFAGEQLYYGRGAGSYPTAFSVFCDIRDAILERRYAAQGVSDISNLLDDENILLDVYIRFHDPEFLHLIDVDFITEGIIDEDFRIVIAQLSISKIKALLPALSERKAFLALLGKISIQGDQELQAVKRSTYEEVF
jgi:homoserine dehydrogenase